MFFQTFENEGRYYECDLLPFMEVGSVSHKYYLLNIRLPVNDRKKINVGIGEIKDIRLVVSGPLIGTRVFEGFCDRKTETLFFLN